MHIENITVDSQVCKFDLWRIRAVSKITKANPQKHTIMSRAISLHCYITPLKKQYNAVTFGIITVLLLFRMKSKSP